MLGRWLSWMHGVIFNAPRHLPMTLRLSSVCFRGDIVVSSCADLGFCYGRRCLLKFLLASYRARDNTFKTIHTAGWRDRPLETDKKKRTRKILDMKHGIDVEKKLLRPYRLALIIMQININQKTRRLF